MNRKIFFKKFIISFVLAVAIIGAGLCFANLARAQQTPDLGLEQVSSTIGLPSTDIRTVVARIIRVALGLLGIVAVVIVLYGGFMWMTAGGNDERVGKAKKILFNGLIGLVIILCSYAIVSFVISKLVGATTGDGSGASSVGPGPGPCVGLCLDYKTFYIKALPASGQVCIRNYHPAVTFNQAVDITTVNSSTIEISYINVQGVTVMASGSWKYASSTKMIGGILTNVADETTAEFVPAGDCLDNGPKDCFLATTTYSFKFISSSNIKNKSNNLSLTCLPQDPSKEKACKNFQFTTGENVDRTPPQITLLSIKHASGVKTGLFYLGDDLRAEISYKDDNGIQLAKIQRNNQVLSATSTNECKKIGTINLDWGTLGWPSGTSTLDALIYDFTMSGDAISTDISLEKSCSKDGDCSSICPEAGGGICLNGSCVCHTTITAISPTSGATSTYVSVAGYLFGSSTGEVYIKNASNVWVKAPLADCGNSKWSDTQIIMEIPTTSASSTPIQVRPSSFSKSLNSKKYIDVSTEDFNIPNFKVNATIHPGLCYISPEFGEVGTAVSLVGKNFGANIGSIRFGSLIKAPISYWSDSIVKGLVPYSLNIGTVGVQIEDKSGELSNGVKFKVDGASGSNLPYIESIYPEKGAGGEYITINGKYFGTAQGKILFKKNNISSEVGINNDPNFPAGCSLTWTDTQIIAKFPKNQGDIGANYSVQVITAAKKSSVFGGAYFKLQSGEPNPGVCQINPTSGPAPFASNATMQIVGEYFGATTPSVYFWQSGASSSSISSRAQVTAGKIKSFSSSTLGDDLVFYGGPPTNSISGPVIVYRTADTQMSNPLNFAVWDCVKNNNTCFQQDTLGQYKCCSAGKDQGFCKSAGDLCDGETRSAGYIWRFSTKEIPKQPHVVERCDSGTNAVPPQNIPSPSPSAQWDDSIYGDHHNVCRTASVVVEFNSNKIQNISSQHIIVNKCSSSSVNLTLRDCSSLGKVTMEDYQGGTSEFKVGDGANDAKYIELNIANGEKWEDDTWYQVVLTDGIKAVSGTISTNLAADKPCKVAGSAYCFLFKTNSRDCKMKAVYITPYKYLTTFLESPIKDLWYRGHGMSDQNCIMMNTKGFKWDWSSSNTLYADIYYGAGTANTTTVQASSKSNTVNIGLKNPDNAVNINAVASTGSLKYFGQSPLTIDLTHPAIVDYWPKCTEACTNAEVGVRFNTTMSGFNLNTKSVRLLECQDENCLSVKQVDNAKDIIFDSNSNPKNIIIKIANSLPDSKELTPNRKFKVSISASTTDMNSEKLLWTATSSYDLNSKGFPYNEEFNWSFATKKSKCEISKVDVTPSVFTTKLRTDRAVYQAETYSSPDACNANGQKINPWSVDWAWSTSDKTIADLFTANTKGFSGYCTNRCVRRGSYISFDSTSVSPVCGNNKIEAGEDCDPPNVKSCGLDCLNLGNNNTTSTTSTIDLGLCGDGFVSSTVGEECDPGDTLTAIGCNAKCLHIGSSITPKSNAPNSSDCGSGLMGSGEDCDIGIKSNPADPHSALGCSDSCLHFGTNLTGKWCFDNKNSHGGFSTSSYDEACLKSISQCGNGVKEPEEDEECELGSGKISQYCDNNCLKNSSSLPDDECKAVPLPDGCDNNKQNAGSSLFYKSPSVCGDGAVGSGEDKFCETNLLGKHLNKIDPWALAIGIGDGSATGNPPKQIAVISAASGTSVGAIKGSGNFEISCGYSTDAECDKLKSGDGVALNSCCYARPKLVSVYPGTTSTIKIEQDICPNTAIEAEFDKKIDENTLSNNFVIARGTAQNACGSSEIDVTNSITLSANIQPNSPWYIKVWAKIANFFRGLFGSEVYAWAPGVVKWCAGEDSAVASVADVLTVGNSKISLSLSAPLATDTYYAIILKENIRDERGVGIGKTKNASGSDVNWHWEFKTGSNICELKSITVVPDSRYLSRYGATTTLDVEPYADKGAKIQMIQNHYAWEYVWEPWQNVYITFASTTTSTPNTLTAQNRNGELDVRVSAWITTNKYSNQSGFIDTDKAHVVLFFCEHPWPPKDPKIIFPYEDKEGNNDHYDMALSNSLGELAFDGKPTELSPFGGYFNFRTYYCADNGSVGIYDDLPYLKPTVQVASNVVSATTSLKRFLFTNDNNSDAIGIQVFPNPNRLKVSEWFKNEKSFVGSMRSVKVDGYDAITDGSNIYVDVLNFVTSSGILYNNIYLFSINSDAKSETQKVFNQMISNLKFNINLTNYGYCGVSVENPGNTTTCQNDLDCSGGEFCSVQTDKLKRNYDRLRDLQEIQSVLEGDNLGLNGWWHFDETMVKVNTDNVVMDSSGNNLNGKIVGNGVASGQSGITGKAYSFKYTGVNSPNYIQLPAEKISKKEFTVAFWAKFSDLKCNRQPFSIITSNSKEFLSFFTQPVANSACLYSSQCQNNTSDCFSGLTMNVLDKGKCAIGQMFSTSTWYHIAGVVDADSGFMKVYKNGVKVCESAINKGDISVAPSKILVGSSLGGQNQHIGMIDEIKIFNRALTGSEIYSQMSAVNTEAGKKMTFPDMKSGSYLSGQSLSVWSSWTTLANVLSKSLPYDPINEIGIAGTCKTSPTLFCVNNYQCPASTCVLHDSTTGWSTEDRRFSFACATSSYAYRYLYSTSTGYMIRAHFENPFGQYINDINLNVNGWSSFAGDFIDLNRFTISDASGICMQDQEISTINQGRCGDSVLNIDKGEECDPPGKTIYDKSNCDFIGNSAVFKTCDSKCKWSQSTMPCSSFSKCGNGILELGEYCDDGKLNGSYNKCNKICAGKAAPYGYKDYDEQGNLAFESFGYCGDGVRTPKLNNIFYELCDYSMSGYSLYSKSKEKSCSYDCQNYGQYCGDGIVQNSSAYPNLINANEECEGTASKTCTTTVSGVVKQGTQTCDSTNCVFQACTTTAQSVAVSSTYCGDGTIQSGEECDTGTANLNKVCESKYGIGCSYCTDKCTVKIIDPSGYCGDGIVQKSNESCDWDKTSKIIYSAVSSTGTYLYPDQKHLGFQVLQCSEEAWVNGQSKAGSKTCDSKCELKDNCVKCGIDEERGVEVAGEIINVLDPKSNNPLLAGVVDSFLNKLYASGLYGNSESCCGFNALVSLRTSQTSTVIAETQWSSGKNNTSTRQYILKKPFAYLAPLQLTACSYPNCVFESKLITSNSSLVAASSDCSYKIKINNDDKHLFDVLVADKKIAKPWQYDFILSPIIPKSFSANTALARPYDVRVVVSYTGSVVFTGGFQFYYDPLHLFPSLTSNLIKLEGNSFKVATGTNYYQGPSSSAIWYHGFGSTKNQISVESFTIDNDNYSLKKFIIKPDGASGYEEAPEYSKRIFYVRMASLYDGIYKYKNTANLKVDVYFPKDDDKYFFRHFDNKPDKTFYLKDAIDSDNKNSATFWQVFNLAPGSNTIEEINAIKTDPKYFEYSASK